MRDDELHYVHDKFVRLIKERKKHPNDKDVLKKLSAIWALMKKMDA